MTKSAPVPGSCLGVVTCNLPEPGRSSPVNQQGQPLAGRHFPGAHDVQVPEHSGDLVAVLACPRTIAVVGHDDIFDALATAFSTGKAEAASSLFRADYLDHQRGEGSDLIGPAEFIAVVAGARRSLGNLNVRVASAVTCAGDLCVAVLAWRGRNRNGTAVERETVETLRLDTTGKIVEHWGWEVRCRHAAKAQAELTTDTGTA
jgi:predicted SnoaL-like aldol condensation-catalyzing enzyme